MFSGGLFSSDSDFVDRAAIENGWAIFGRTSGRRLFFLSRKRARFLQFAWIPLAGGDGPRLFNKIVACGNDIHKS